MGMYIAFFRTRLFHMSIHVNIFRAFFIETLFKVKELRPDAKWGYYIYPKCNYKPDKQKCAGHMYTYIEQ